MTKAFDCKITAFFISVAIAAGAVVAVASGYYLSYLAVTLIGN